MFIYIEPDQGHNDVDNAHCTVKLNNKQTFKQSTVELAYNVPAYNDFPFIRLKSYTGCPRIFRNKNKTFIRLCKTVFCQKIISFCL